ncbi:glycosyltransferase family 4 protein [Microbacterium sp. nov. GSS16]|uniref:glycosyltransferase family 4 protein n=1 Tax=Microbacterium sp. nov. GSS16 TaxID=3019890 RepID=UPI002305201D|nr:glycosyltransferase family 1 protein [Microbacterium sp. nov. GSS16]WCD92895.1 glycosyltransferase family 1 protein [Microbacterium sp. nov. GSS16]
MRVLFDAYWWSSGPRSNASVQRGIIHTWAEAFPEDELAIAVRGNEIQVEGNAGGLDSRFDVQRTYSPLQALTNGIEVPRIARRWGADAVVAHNFAPRLRSGVSAVFVHDFLFLDHPGWFTPIENVYFRRMRTMARHADVIATSSESEARRIKTHLGRTVSAIGLANSPTLMAAVPVSPFRSPPQTFLLAVARLNLRKNLNNIVEAAMLSGVVSPKFPLIVVGESSGKVDHIDAVSAAAAGSVVFLGNVSDGELRWLYERASLFLHLSLGEGFGLPGIEALAFGTPILASDIPVFRETLRGSATFVDPLDVHSVAKHIASVRSGVGMSPGEGAFRRGLDLVRRSGYSWSAMVDKLRSDLLAAGA